MYELKDQTLKNVRNTNSDVKDFNTSVDNNTNQKEIGKLGLSCMNVKNIKLLEFCKLNNIIIYYRHIH